MGHIGLKAYRMSISWPRVLPEGKGTVNQQGLDFYDRLIDELLSHNITPYITLFHWDYPYELYKIGGWLCQESSDWFADYARIIVEKLSDRVENWITLNEPQAFALVGHKDGLHAPAVKYDQAQMYQLIHNVLLAHGKSVQAIRQASKLESQIGYAPVGVAHIPASESPEDVEAARQNMFSIKPDGLWSNAIWMDPIFLGKYSDEYLEMTGIHRPIIKEGDMKIISQPLDFLGANIYNGMHAEVQKDRPEFDLFTAAPFLGGCNKSVGTTGMDWPITPEAIYWGPKFFHERYGKPIFITENGLANMDWPSLDGKIHDPQRIDFLTRYLHQLKKAKSHGVDIRGYFHWSLTDNFEWLHGYSKRFGMIYVDYNTQQRTMKDSAYWYQGVIESNGALL